MSVTHYLLLVISGLTIGTIVVCTLIYFGCGFDMKTREDEEDD